MKMVGALKTVGVLCSVAVALAAAPTPVGTATGSCLLAKGYNNGSAVTADDKMVSCFESASSCAAETAYKGAGSFFNAGAIGDNTSPNKGCCMCLTGCDTTKETNDATACMHARGDTFGDYTAVSNVSPHAAIILDVTKFEKQVDLKKYTEASTTYSTGVHSPKNGTWRNLEDLATYDGSAEPFTKNTLAALARSPDAFVKAAFAGTPSMFSTDANKKQALQKTAQCIMHMYTSHEFFAAIAKAKKCVDGTKTGEDCEDAKGGAHNWDEARAFFYGPSNNGGKNAPWEVPKKRDGDFGTANAAAIDAAFTEGLVAVRGAKPDIAKAQAAYDKYLKHMMIAFVQAGLKYGYKEAFGDADVCEYCDTAIPKTGYDLMEGYAYFRCGAGSLHQIAPEATAKILKTYEDGLAAGKLDGATWCSGIKKVVDGISGLTSAELGHYDNWYVKSTCGGKPAAPSSTPSTTTPTPSSSASGVAGLGLSLGLALVLASLK